MRHFLLSWTNSIGSSIVMTWSERVRLIRSMSAQSVVDFPEPVGPVTRTSPFVRWQRRCTSCEMPICSTVTTAAGMARNTAPVPLRSLSALPRKRATPGISCAKSVSLISLNSARFCSSITAFNITSMSSEVRTASPGIGAISPLARSSGGEPERKCRSDALLLTSVRRRVSILSSARLPVAVAWRGFTIVVSRAGASTLGGVAADCGTGVGEAAWAAADFDAGAPGLEPLVDAAFGWIRATIFPFCVSAMWLVGRSNLADQCENLRAGERLLHHGPRRILDRNGRDVAFGENERRAVIGLQEVEKAI